MEKPQSAEPGFRSKVKRFLKARLLNIAVILVVIICIILYVRGDADEDELQVYIISPAICVTKTLCTISHC